jgi:hypothetical protein
MKKQNKSRRYPPSHPKHPQHLANKVLDLIDFYESRRFTGRDAWLEPSWTIAPYEAAYRWAAGHHSQQDLEDLDFSIDCFECTGMVGLNLIGQPKWNEDGVHVATASWVFMGRTLPDALVFPYSTGIVAVGRRPSKAVLAGMEEAFGPCIRDEHLWIVYSVTESLHTRGIGPCRSHDQAMGFVPWEFPDQVPGR